DIERVQDVMIADRHLAPHLEDASMPLTKVDRFLLEGMPFSPRADARARLVETSLVHVAERALRHLFRGHVARRLTGIDRRPGDRRRDFRRDAEIEDVRDDK